jgi:hypothetical protein
MAFLAYSIIGLSIFKLLIDALGGNTLAVYSVLLENILFGFLLAVLIRTSIRQKEARRETLQEDIEQMRKETKEERDW